MVTTTDNLIKTLNKFEKFDQLVHDCTNLLHSVPFKDNVNQIALQVRNLNNVSEKDWYESCGSVYKKGSHDPLIEDLYSHINPALKGTAIEEWLLSFNVDVWRARLMLVNEKTCYSVHRDITPRIHIPIITNPNCYMCFPKLGIMEHLPATGESYWVDTTKDHTFVNCSSLDRIHLVVSTRHRFTD
jgi:hypothetical protein